LIRFGWNVKLGAFSKQKVYLGWAFAEAWQSLGFRVQDTGYRVQGSGFRV
jgi:hypothetical protein